MLVLVGKTGAIPQFGINHRVKLAREYAGMQQHDLADKTGLSRTSIANMETGRTKPRKKTITIIASATGVDREWLATGNAPVYITETGDPDVGSKD